eukprot:6210167-Pleurochrysis_carterae.AAC.4
MTAQGSCGLVIARDAAYETCLSCAWVFCYHLMDAAQMCLAFCILLIFCGVAGVLDACNIYLWFQLTLAAVRHLTICDADQLRALTRTVTRGAVKAIWAFTPLA